MRIISGRTISAMEMRRSFGDRWAAFSRASVFPTLAEALKSDSGTGRSAVVHVTAGNHDGGTTG